MRHFEMFTGRVGQIRDLIELPKGNCVVSFSVAETPRIKKDDGTWVDGTTIWTDVSVFGDEARNFVRSAKPGVFVTVAGTRRAREYEAKDTKEKRVVQQVVADQVAISLTKFNYVESIGNVNYAKEGRGGGAPAQTQNTQASQPVQTAQSNPFNTEDPFNNNTANDNDPFGAGGDPFGAGGDPFGGDDDDPFALT